MAVCRPFTDSSGTIWRSMKSSKTVLVVDDTALNLALLTAILRNSYQVKVAKSGERALEMVAADPPDLILLDVVMPGLSGLDVLERLQAAPVTRHIPVICISALAEERHQATARSLGAVGYIAKPFEPEGVLAAVGSALSFSAP